MSNTAEEADSKKRVLPQQDEIGAAIKNKRGKKGTKWDFLFQLKLSAEYNISTSIYFLLCIAALNPSEAAKPQVQTQNFINASEKYTFKILCPQSITGIIIGKGGSTINQLNGSTGVSIKLSQNNEYFPSTNNDRILLCKNLFTPINLM